jgi:hypothetical protein
VNNELRVGRIGLSAALPTGEKREKRRFLSRPNRRNLHIEKTGRNLNACHVFCLIDILIFFRSLRLEADDLRQVAADEWPVKVTTSGERFSCKSTSMKRRSEQLTMSADVSRPTTFVRECRDGCICQSRPARE